MPIVLFRVDERLIHGQVVVGWGGPLHADRMVVVDDELAASPWEQELYCLGVPAEIEARFLSVDEARAAVPTWQAEARRTIVLVRDVATAGRMARDGVLKGVEVNLGGIHFAQGRARILSYLHLRPDETEELRRIEAAGAQVAARDLPGGKRVPLSELTPG